MGFSTASNWLSVSSGTSRYLKGNTSGRCCSGIRYVVVFAPLELTVVLMFCGGTMLGLVNATAV